MKSRLASVSLYLFGALHWLFFFNLGSFPFKVLDWPKELAYLTILRQALTQGLIPFHAQPAFQTTDRFLALPETLLSPQIALLPFMNIGTFVVVNTLIMYSVGFIGCLLIKNRYRLSGLSFTVLFLLFNFNGYITSHLAVGHLMWLGYFLLPLFCLLLLELVEAGDPIAISVKLSFLLFVMNLQGAFHIFVWCVMFMVLLAICNRPARTGIVIALLFGIASSAFRYVPAALTFYHKGYPFVFISAYPTIGHLLGALAVIRYPGYCPFTIPMGWWEFDVYISVIGILFLAYYGIVARFRNVDYFRQCSYKAFDIPILGMALLSVGMLYPLIAKLPLPFLNSQRFSSRFIIIPITMLVVISCIRLQAALSRRRLDRRSAALAGSLVIILAVLLISHSDVWNIAALQSSAAVTMIVSNPVIVYKSDVFYKAATAASSLVSILSLTAMFVLSVYRRLRLRQERELRALNA